MVGAGGFAGNAWLAAAIRAVVWFLASYLPVFPMVLVLDLQCQRTGEATKRATQEQKKTRPGGPALHMVFGCREATQ